MAAVKGTRPPNAGKGRKKGVPNKVTGELKTMILQALDGAGGVEYLTTCAREHPGPFLALVGKVLPLQVTGGDGTPLIPQAVSIVFTQQPNSDNRT